MQIAELWNMTQTASLVIQRGIPSGKHMITYDIATKCLEFPVIDPCKGQDVKPNGFFLLNNRYTVGDKPICLVEANIICAMFANVDSFCFSVYAQERYVYG